MCRTVRGIILLFAFCIVLFSQNKAKPITLEDFRWDSNRDAVQNTQGILAALQISQGSWVADVGAGSGYHAMLLSAMVGSSGRVFAENIDDGAIRYVLARIQLFNLLNVESVKGEVDNPLLPEKKLDAVLIVNTFHHFTAPEAMLKRIHQGLKPGGRLVIADYSISEHRELPRAAQIRAHEIDPILVRAEAERAGFQFVRVEDPFFVWKTTQGNTRTTPTDLWLMILKCPE